VRQRYLVDLLRRLAPFLTVFGGVYVAASLGFWYLESGRVDLLDSFYWAIVSLSTVGYGDFVPTTETARAFVIVVLFIQIFLGGYLLSVIVGVVSEESQKRLLGTLGTDMKDHSVVLGYGPVGKVAVRDLLIDGLQVGVIAENAEEVPNIHILAPASRLYVTYGNPAEVEMLKRANVPEAHSVIVACADDTTSLIAALNVRTLAPKARIVVSVSRPELKTTLETAGVTYVASPAEMGGRICANAAFQPEVALALEDLSEEGNGADIREYVLSAATPVSTHGLLEAEALVRQHTGCLIVGAARPGADGNFVTSLNPPESWKFQPGDAIMVLGLTENQERFKKWIRAPQGR
jgi:voltage-gated potassium channel